MLYFKNGFPAEAVFLLTRYVRCGIFSEGMNLVHLNIDKSIFERRGHER